MITSMIDRLLSAGHSGNTGGAMPVYTKAILALIVLVATACTSDYRPSQAMLDYRKTLTTQAATAQLQNYLWPEQGQDMICATRGFWIDENARFTVLDDKFAMFAYRQGELVRTEGSGFASTHIYEREYYRHMFEFSEVEKVLVHKRFGLLNSYRGCIKPEEPRTYFVVDLIVSEQYNLKFIVYEEQFDEIMAVVTKLLPDKPVEVNG